MDYREKKRIAHKLESHHSHLVARDIKFKNLQRIESFNQELFNLGKKYFNDGFLLDDISEDFKSNRDFMRGYNKAVHEKSVNESLVILGTKWFIEGKLIEDAPDNYKNNEYFVLGYNNGKNLEHDKKRNHR